MKLIDNILPLKEFHSDDKPYMSLSEQQRKAILLFNKRIASAEVGLETVPCLCGGEDFDLIASYDRYSMIQNTVLCRGCGLILSNPRLTNEEYVRFYKTDIYRKIYESYNYLEIYRQKYKTSTARHIFDSIVAIRKIGQIHKVMEFGAGGGWNLIPFKEKGISVTGYDYSSSLVSLGREYGLNLLQGEISDIDGSYDVIILNHVLEHLTDIKASVKKLKQHLNPGGILYIAVPNIKNFSMGHFQIAHTYYFSLSTLQYYMSQCGLKMISNGVAQKIHMYVIFEDAGKNLDKDFLSRHYEEMKLVIRRYYLGELSDRLFIVGGFKRLVRPILDSRLGIKTKLAIIKLFS